MQNTDLVSVVVPVYNKARFIGETIESVLGQSYKDIELILVDDGSSDDSVGICSSYATSDDRIKCIYGEGNVGAAMCRNRGTKAATGRFLCFLDADDLWLMDKLDEQVAFMKQNKCPFSFTGYEFADEEGHGTGKIVNVPESIVYKEALKNTTIFTSTVMIDLDQVSKEDAYMPNIASEDTATWWHLLKKYGQGYGLAKNLVKYRRSANTLSSDKLVAIRRIWNLYRKQEGLSVCYSLYCMVFWALRAVLRRI